MNTAEGKTYTEHVWHTVHDECMALVHPACRGVQECRTERDFPVIVSWTAGGLWGE